MFEDETKKFANLLETKTFDEIYAHMESIKNTNNFEYALFFALIYNNNILHKILEYKVSLAIFVSKQSEVNVLPEDRTRLIYLLAKLPDLSYEKASEATKKEFGPNFQLPENITVNKKTYNWKVLAKRAKEIKKGIYNNCYFQVLDLVKVLHKYFTLFKETDPKIIEGINKLSLEIIAILNSSPLVGMPYEKRREELIPKIQEFYKLTNRINLDIKKVEENPDFTAILDYTIAIHMGCDIKLDLISKKMSPTDSAYAFKSLLRHFGEMKFNDLLDTSEIERFGKYLDPATIQTIVK